jgi:hypothetical protein
MTGPGAEQATPQIQQIARPNPQCLLCGYAWRTRSSALAADPCRSSPQQTRLPAANNILEISKNKPRPQSTIRHPDCNKIPQPASRPRTSCQLARDHPPPRLKASTSFPRRCGIFLNALRHRFEAWGVREFCGEVFAGGEVVRGDLQGPGESGRRVRNPCGCKRGGRRCRYARPNRRALRNAPTQPKSCQGPK